MIENGPEAGDDGPPRAGYYFEPEAWLSAIVNSAREAIIGKTLDGEIVSWNSGAEELFGYSADEALGQPISMLADPDRSTEMAELLRRVRRGERVERLETSRRRKDGSIVPVALTISPIRNRDGELIGASKIARDITERKRSEEHLRLLSADLEHRTKNLLSVVIAIIQQTRHESVSTYREAIEGRIIALDRVNSLLSGDAWLRTDFATIVEHILMTFRLRSEDFEVNGPPVVVGPHAAQTLAMTIHELGTNAVKYGALSGGGKVAIDWEPRADGIRIRWREFGGPSVRAPSKRGTGLDVIRTGVQNQLGGKLEMRWPATGLVCNILLPATHIVD